MAVAYIFPSYKERDNLVYVISNLGPSLADEDLIIIADDSPKEEREALELAIRGLFEKVPAEVAFSYSSFKSGRGSAVRRGLRIALGGQNHYDHIVEADSDGSHRPKDIAMIAMHESSAELLIGSRYLPNSEIAGWSRRRKIFSKFLNLLIPKLLNVETSDITNGLRRYSKRAAVEILNFDAENDGFMYLSETASALSRAGLSIEDVAIRFEDRMSGVSNVSWGEIRKSLEALVRLTLRRYRS